MAATPTARLIAATLLLLLLLLVASATQAGHASPDDPILCYDLDEYRRDVTSRVCPKGMSRLDVTRSERNIITAETNGAWPYDDLD